MINFKTYKTDATATAEVASATTSLNSTSAFLDRLNQEVISNSGITYTMLLVVASVIAAFWYFTKNDNSGKKKVFRK